MEQSRRDAIAQKLASAFTELLDAVMEEYTPPPKNVGIHSVEELMEMFHKSRCTILSWIREGQFGEPVENGKVKIVNDEGLEFYIKNHTTAAYTPRTPKPKKAMSLPRRPVERI